MIIFFQKRYTPILNPDCQYLGFGLVRNEEKTRDFIVIYYYPVQKSEEIWEINENSITKQPIEIVEHTNQRIVILNNCFFEIFHLNIEVKLYVQDDMNTKLNLILFSLLYDLNHIVTNQKYQDEYNMEAFDIRN